MFMNKRNVSVILPYLYAALIAMSLWLVGLNLVLYLVEEKYYLVNHLDQEYRTLGLVATVALLATISRKHFNKWVGIGSIVLFLGVIIVQSYFVRFYHQFQYIPEIRSISKNWTVQGDVIVITGRDFGEVLRPGTVRVGELEYKILDWNNHYIEAQQPIPDGYYKAPLVVCNYLDVCTEAGVVEIKDPAYL
jgi:hypothetical protein